MESLLKANPMRYDKLVRDKIPEKIKANGDVPVTHVATAEEFRGKLSDKLVEEADEFRKNPTLEELADSQEVIDAILADRGWTREQLEEARKEKAEKRGAFTQRIILDETR